MANLNLNRFLLSVFFALISACATSTYKITKQSEYQTEIHITTDRIILECEDIQHEYEKDMYGFMIHLLDEENTVSTVIQGNSIGKKDCEYQLRVIGKIIKMGKDIYIGSFGALKAPRVKTEYTHHFPSHGTFHGNGRVLQFGVIANEKNDCFSFAGGEDKPCPRDEFPIRD